MFAKIFTLFALLAVAFAAPNPKPQLITYSSGLDYVYPGGSVVPTAYSAYAAPAVGYSGYPDFAAPVAFLR